MNETRQISYRKSGKIWDENPDLGSRGSEGAISTVNLNKRLAQKLRRTILLHFGLIIFKSHFGKPGNPSFSWFSDLADVTMTPTTNYFQPWRHQNYFK